MATVPVGNCCSLDSKACAAWALSLVSVCAGNAGAGIQLTTISDHDEIIESGYLKVAVYEDYPPYSFIRGMASPGVTSAGQGTGLRAGRGVALQWRPDETFDGDLRNHHGKFTTCVRGGVRSRLMCVPNTSVQHHA